MRAGWTSWSEITGTPSARPEPWSVAARHTSPPAQPMPAESVRAGSSEAPGATDADAGAHAEAGADAAAAPAVPLLPSLAERPAVSPVDQPGDPKYAVRRRRRGLTALGVAVLAFVAGAAGGVMTGVLPEERRPENTVTVLGAKPVGVGGRSPDSAARVAAQVLPSVVSVSVAGASGSGFVISADGHVLTNHHVVAVAGEDGTIQLTLFDGRQVEAKLVGTSRSYDVAVLETKADNLRPVVLGDSASVAVGDPVMAIGSPLGLDATVTSGIVSALERPVTAGDPAEQSFINALQTDAAINPGNSGGPLVDASGRVIGMNSAIATVGPESNAGSIGLGFAIPIDQVQRTAQQLIRNGEAVYPVMGVLLDDGFVGPGVRVASDGDAGPGVSPDGPADRAGLRSGDVIVKIDGEKVRAPAELIVRLRAHEPGDEVTLVVERDGERLEFTVTLDAAVG
jgi:putative serine protease PepD